MDKNQMVLLPVMNQAGIETSYTNGEGEVVYGTFMCGYEQVVNLASLLVQKERLEIIKLLPSLGVELTQAQIESICDRREEWV